MMAIPTGIMAPPPMPWTTRKKMMNPRLGDRAHANEPAAKSTIDQMKTGLRPSRSAIHPVTGCTTPTARRYAVMIHSTPLCALMLLPIGSSATVTIVVSRITMNVPMSTTPRAVQR